MFQDLHIFDDSRSKQKPKNVIEIYYLAVIAESNSQLYLKPPIINIDLSLCGSHKERTINLI